MGAGTATRTTYRAESKRRGIKEDGSSITEEAERQAKQTGVLDKSVDPSSGNVIRECLPRLIIDQKTGLWQLSVGMSLPVEARFDTTGSMGRTAIKNAYSGFMDTYELCTSVMPAGEYDPHFAIGVFNDKEDQFVLCRPEFEMKSAEIINCLSHMIPLKAGGDDTEDPHYGIFGGAYLTRAYCDSLGKDEKTGANDCVKGYDFTITDADSRTKFDKEQLIRIYGDKVFEKIAENGFQIASDDLPDLNKVVRDLQKRAHAFVLLLHASSSTINFWQDIYGRERVVIFHDTQFLPHIMAVIIGITEGTLGLQDVYQFLTSKGVGREDAERISSSVQSVPVGAQANLKNHKIHPRKGDLFREKPNVRTGTNLWPVSRQGEESAIGSSDEIAGQEDEKRKSKVRWI